VGRFLDADARAAFKHAIETIENASAVEVVVAMRRQSGSYRHANVAIASTLAFVGLAVMLFAEHEFGLASILIDPFVIALVGGGLVEVLPWLKRHLTTTGARRRTVAAAARAHFVDHGVHATTRRSGLLVYMSWLERQVALVADLGLLRTLPPGALVHAEQELTDAMRGGGVAVARKLEALAPMMASAMPQHPDDVNELPDAIDSDMDGT